MMDPLLSAGPSYGFTQLPLHIGQFDTTTGRVALFKKILVVCVGNICRSPTAEMLLRNALEPSISVTSAGLGARVGESIIHSAAMRLVATRLRKAASTLGATMRDVLGLADGRLRLLKSSDDGPSVTANRSYELAEPGMGRPIG